MGGIFFLLSCITKDTEPCKSLGEVCCYGNVRIASGGDMWAGNLARKFRQRHQDATAALRIETF